MTKEQEAVESLRQQLADAQNKGVKALIQLTPGQETRQLNLLAKITKTEKEVEILWDVSLRKAPPLIRSDYPKNFGGYLSEFIALAAQNLETDSRAIVISGGPANSLKTTTINNSEVALRRAYKRNSPVAKFIKTNRLKLFANVSHDTEREKVISAHPELTDENGMLLPEGTKLVDASVERAGIAALARAYCILIQGPTTPPNPQDPDHSRSFGIRPYSALCALPNVVSMYNENALGEYLNFISSLRFWAKQLPLEVAQQSLAFWGLPVPNTQREQGRIFGGAPPHHVRNIEMEIQNRLRTMIDQKLAPTSDIQAVLAKLDKRVEVTNFNEAVEAEFEKFRTLASKNSLLLGNIDQDTAILADMQRKITFSMIYSPMLFEHNVRLIKPTIAVPSWANPWPEVDKRGIIMRNAIGQPMLIEQD